MPFDGRILSGVSVLAAVVDGGSFVKAAELIGLTDSGVSRAISRLETRLGVRLLDRTTRSVTLTDEGRRFYEEVKPHLNAIEDAAIVASGAVSAVRGRLRIDIDPFFLPLVLAGRLGAFCERYPELAIEFVTSEHVGDLVSEGIDLAIRFGQPRLSTLVSRKLIEAPILTLASPRYLERYGKPEHPSDLARHRCLQFLDPYTGRPFDWEFIRGKEIDRGADQRPADLHRSQVHAGGMRRRHGHRPGHRLGCQGIAGEWRASRSFSRLARRALPAVRLPSITQASAGQSPGFYGFLCRHSWQAMMIDVAVARRFFNSNIVIGCSPVQHDPFPRHFPPDRDHGAAPDARHRLSVGSRSEFRRRLRPTRSKRLMKSPTRSREATLDDLRDELGDLLLQVVYHARMAEEQNAFSFGDVVEAITKKMIRRHPHVFADKDGNIAPAGVKSTWERIKAEEKAERAARRPHQQQEHPSLLAGTKAGQPALTRAMELQRKASSVGFDWNDPRAVLRKIHEEADEIEAALDHDDAEELAAETGDLMFALVNLARHVGANPEMTLRGANAKFERRFAYIERALASQGRMPEAASLAEMDALWNEAKANET